MPTWDFMVSLFTSWTLSQTGDITDIYKMFILIPNWCENMPRVLLLYCTCLTITKMQLDTDMAIREERRVIVHNGYVGNWKSVFSLFSDVFSSTFLGSAFKMSRIIIIFGIIFCSVTNKIFFFFPIIFWEIWWQ